jgi:beta-ketodecanoyl-[acyl-carrier-protein] synthase
LITLLDLSIVAAEPEEQGQSGSCLFKSPGEIVMSESTAVISATGLWTPPDSISNTELVASFNAYVEQSNADNAEAIARGDQPPLQPSSVEFIEKASGIRSRFVVSKAPILDPAVMRPGIAERPNDQISILAEMAVAAARDALTRAGRDTGDVDAVLCAWPLKSRML